MKSDQKQFQAAWLKAWREDGDERARDLLVESVMGLVYDRVGRVFPWARRGTTRDDLVSEAVAEVMLAIENFDEDRGGPFSACAHDYICGAVMGAANRSQTIFTIPKSRYERRLSRHLAPLVRAFEDLGLPSGEALRVAAEGLGVREIDAAESMAIRHVVSLNACTSDPAGEGDEQAREVADASADGVEAAVQSRDMLRVVREILDRLDQTEREVVMCHLMAEPKESLDSIAARLGVSRERVRKIEAAALAQLRAVLSRKGLSFDLLIA